jgi:tripartite-type tricarboxylate transporter receptor subunit TctC
MVDSSARVITDRLGARLGQQVLIENRGGAAGNVGHDFVAKAAPDGYTLLIANTTTHVLNPLSNSKLGYDPLKDFATISMAVQLQNMFIVHPTVAAKSITELIALAKQKPGALNYASSGLGSPGHLAGELFKTMAKVEMTHIPYKGGGPALSDLLGGQLPVFVAVISTGVPPVKSGRAVALAVTGAKRSAVLPDVPTVAETAALKGYEASNWYCMMAPADTPNPVIERLQKDLTNVLNNSSIRDQLAAQGIESTPSSPEEFTNYIRTETAKWSKVIRAANLKAN